MKFLPYIWKTLWRHRRRTLLTGLGAAVAVFLFCVLASLQDGFHAVADQHESALVVFQANKFCPATSLLPEDYARRILSLPGVQSVAPILVYTNNCRASLDVIVFYGMPAAALRATRHFRFVQGDWSSFEGRQDAAIVGKAVAQRRRLNAGDRFTIGPITVTIAGVYDDDNPNENNYIYTHLDFLQRRKGEDLVGSVTQHEVYLNAGSNADEVCRRIDDEFRGGPVQTYTRPKGIFQTASLADLVELIHLTGYLGYACVGLVVVMLSTTTLMSVQDRRQEHAVLQTIGFSGPRIFGLVLAECTLLGTIGGWVGVGLALLVLQQSGLSIGAEAVAIAFRPSLWLGLTGMALAAALAVLAGVLPALQAAGVDIVSSLKQE